MSWYSRFGNMTGRFSPFTRSPPQGSTRVSDGDFSYITADDLRKHGSDTTPHHHPHHHGSHVDESSVDMGPPRETDCLILRNKKKDHVVHFPAYSIAKGQLTVGQVREHAAKKTGTADARRVKLLYLGKNLSDDSRSCRAEGLRNESELLCTIAEGVLDDEEDEEDDGEGEEDDDAGEAEGGVGLGGEQPRRKRNRGKKTKRRNKRDATQQQASGTSTPAELNIPQPSTAASSQHSRAPSPRPPPAPMTPMDKLNALRATLETFLPQVHAFKTSPPVDQAKREYEHKKLTETILAQVLLKLDAVETDGDADARARRKELVRETNGVLQDLDAVVKG
ncbi:hypothetical protein BAUCODRAFT_80839 [Baudoinia panamericana UAMH 10762]|uniref:BAG domain-containing protein n=1 Tax=Baudoinia panamericana (strain UAMH 10762) TaxID=717646 RepID=M2MTX9_BAUPA|nr:uncharacterized protein BAUCODRAFT_80839 [Baudoinia panamericana UAMH 10762]EMD00382.1 hypothetical protein BAUCODRAFT_80839 [Baudoinia panamericana UAMH 10762]